MAEVVRHRVDTFVEMQKNLLDAAADQAHAVAESYREGEKMITAAQVADLARRGIEGFIESEKKFLDLASQEVSAAAKGEKRGGKAPRERMEVLTAMAREGAEKYIATQKELLDLAIEELEETTTATKEHKEAVRKEVAHSGWGELTEKSMHNFVAAEKSLLDLATKRIEGLGHGKGRKGARSRRGTPRVSKKHVMEAAESVSHPG